MDFDSAKRYKLFSGKTTGHHGYINQKNAALSEGMVPCNTAGLFYLRDLTKDDNLLFRGVRTGDGVLVHPNGMVKLDPNSRLLNALSRNDRFVNGALALPDGFYEAHRGREYIGRMMTAEEALEGFGVPRELAERNIQAMIKYQKKMDLGFKGNILLFAAPRERVPVLRPVTIDGILNNFNIHLNDDLDLEGIHNRQTLVGVSLALKL